VEHATASTSTGVDATRKLRQAYNATLPITTEFYTACCQWPLYARLKSYSLTAEAEHLEQCGSGCCIDARRVQAARRELGEPTRHGSHRSTTAEPTTRTLSQNVSIQLRIRVGHDGRCRTRRAAESALAAARSSADSKGLQESLTRKPDLIAVADLRNEPKLARLSGAPRPALQGGSYPTSS
jgi:hypothetical protein